MNIMGDKANMDNTDNRSHADIEIQFRRGSTEDLDETEGLVKKAIEYMKQHGIDQ